MMMMGDETRRLVDSCWTIMMTTTASSSSSRHSILRRSGSSMDNEETIFFAMDEKKGTLIAAYDEKEAIYKEAEDSRLSSLLDSCFFLSRNPFSFLWNSDGVLATKKDALVMNRTDSQRPAILTADLSYDNEDEDDESVGWHQQESSHIPLEWQSHCETSLASKASETLASTLSIDDGDSLSFRSWEAGRLTKTSMASSVSSSWTSTKKRGRKIDVYQTDSTMIRNEHEDEWSSSSPLVVLSDQPRLQLPFRHCSKRYCTCRKDPTTTSTNTFEVSNNQPSTPPTLDVNDVKQQDIAPHSESTAPQQQMDTTHAKEYLLQTSSSNNNKDNKKKKSIYTNKGHHRQASDDLQGLWIPVEEVATHLLEEEEGVDDHSTNDDGEDPGRISPTRELRWMMKSHSERNLFSFKNQNVQDDDKSTMVDETSPLSASSSSTSRCRAISEDMALQQQPPVTPPPLGRWSDVQQKKKMVVPQYTIGMVPSGIHKASPLVETSSSMVSNTSSSTTTSSNANRTPSPSNVVISIAPRNITKVPSQRSRSQSKDQESLSNSPHSNAAISKDDIHGSEKSIHRFRSRSEHGMDLSPGDAPDMSASSKRHQETSMTTITPSSKECKDKSIPTTRSRVRSEDVVDQRCTGGTTPSPIIIDTSDDASRGSSSSSSSLSRNRRHRPRANSRDVVGAAVTPTRPKQRRHSQLDNDQGCDQSKSSSTNQHPTRNKSTPRSPTSILEFHAVTSSSSTMSKDKTTTVPTPPSPAQMMYQSSLSHLRSKVNILKRQRTLQAKIELIQVYHEMAWLHYQHVRHDAALCVVNHALERLYWMRKGPSSCCCLTLTETLAYVEDPIKPLLAHLLVTKASIVLSSHTASPGADDGRDMKKDGTVSFQREAKYLTKTAITLVEPLMKQYSPLHPQHCECLVIAAKGMSLLGQLYYGQNRLFKPSLAMDYFQQATSMFQYLVSQMGMLQYETRIAETSLHVGNLHMSQGRLDLAKASYWEALRIYRSIYHRDTESGTSMPCFVLMDMSTTLTNLGWLHLQQKEFNLAHRSTMEALWLLKYYHGQGDSHDAKSRPSHIRSLRNLASVEYQLGMIASIGGQWDQALAFMKAALNHQQHVFREDHPDVAITMEAIGSTYQQLGEWNKAHNFLESAISVRKQALGSGLKRHVSNDPLDVARLQSRLSLVLLELQQYDRAKRMLARAAKRYRLVSVPLDELGRHSKQKLSRVRYKEQNRLTVNA